MKLFTIMLVLIAAFLSTTTFAVGAFFASRTANTQVTFAGARAFIVRDGINEDLTLQVGFFGNATDFAWVVPVPSRPSVKFADDTIFDELHRICNPRIIPNGVRKSTDPRNTSEPAPVKLQDITIIPASDDEALTRWLQNGDYVVPKDIKNLTSDYTKRGWYFIAGRVKTVSDTNSRWLQPLKISFSNKNAILPIKFSMLNTAPFNTQVYIAAKVAAASPGFKEIYVTGTPPRNSFKANDFPLFFQSLVKDCNLTELWGVIDPKTITSDIIFSPK